MSDQSRTLTFEQTVPASPELVYRAFTNSSALREWIADVATTAPRVNGRFYLAWNDGNYASGEITHLEENREVAFTWFGRGEPGKTAVHVSLTPVDAHTHIIVKHSQIGTGTEWQETIASFKEHWPASLENLTSVMTTGEDLRFTQRPMIGISVGDFNADVALQLGVPVTNGIRINDVVSGMGAESAGLQTNDVIVGVNDQEIVDWSSLNGALQKHRAGDAVDVTFYRGAQKKNVAMTLSGRPIPEIPKTAVLLAETARKNYDQNEAELENFYAEVSDAEASFKPAPESWSANETLAHLIHGERGWHTWMDNMIGGHEPSYDDWGGNIAVRVKATVMAYPTTRALLDELKRNNAETIALLANLPEPFLARKSSYWRLAYQMLETSHHHQSHMAQMRKAIEKARQAR